MQPAETAVESIDLTQWEELVARAPGDGAPCIAASYVPGEPPDMSFKGSMMVLDRDHLAWWEWAGGEQIHQLERNPLVSVLYRNHTTRVMLRWYGQATLLREGPVREQVMARAPERELARDPERTGIAVVVRIDRVRLGGSVVQQRG